MFTETSVDWIFLRTAAEFWDPEHAVFNFHGTELAPTIEEYTALIQRHPRGASSEVGSSIRIAWLSDWTLLRAMTPTPASYQRDACHGFLLLVFGTLLFPYSPNLIDGAIAQVVLQAVGGHSYVEALLAETVRSLDYVREVRRGRMRVSPHLLQIWLLAHIRPFCSSHPFSYVADERSLIERLIREIRRQRDASIIQRLYIPEHPIDDERAFSATSAYEAQFYARGLAPPQRSQAAPTPHATSILAPEAESSIQAAMHAELRAVS
ncbi:hypothetical protein CRG98_006407 [Punica granatum]|uniref:DUF7745 domain-containing protein n=1 Tax=Punica granatum TaxID=22663 RepID=A0A2I0KXL8_PUNGR|nr:hypothetical protein CRG98_006407 [Punica granatum]